MSETKTEYMPLDVIGFFKKCKIAHVFNGKVVLAHGGGFDSEAFFDKKYVKSFETNEEVTGENYHQMLNQFRVRLSSTESSYTSSVTVQESIDEYNNLLQEVLRELTEEPTPKFTWKFVLLQALGLKPDDEDARYKSLIQSCSQDGCSGQNPALKYADSATKLAEVLTKSGITHVSYGHKPVCFPIPLIYQRSTINGVTFISNDTSNGNRKVSEIGENTAIGTKITFNYSDNNNPQVETQVELITLDGSESPAKKYSDMFGPYSSKNPPPEYIEEEGKATTLIYNGHKLSFNNLLKPPASYGQLKFEDITSVSGGRRRSRNRKYNTKKRGSKRLSKRTKRNKHHTKRSRKQRKH
jgi:hypothetical protein